MYIVEIINYIEKCDIENTLYFKFEVLEDAIKFCSYVIEHANFNYAVQLYKEV